MGKPGNQLILAIVGMLVGLVQASIYTTNIDPTHLTTLETDAVDQLREFVKAELTAEYMMEDVFLLKWLIDVDFNVDKAAELLKQNLRWREAENINSILDEDWDDLHSKFPYSRETKDKHGRPLLYFDLGQWDVSKLISEEQSSQRLERYFVKLWEESEAHVRDLRAEGQNVTQFNVIINLGDYTLGKQGCFQCFYAYRNIGQELGANYPRPSEKVLAVNAPDIFGTAFAYLSDESNRILNVLGTDQATWESVLLEDIEKHQIPFGLLQNDEDKPE